MKRALTGDEILNEAEPEKLLTIELNVLLLATMVVGHDSHVRARCGLSEGGESSSLG